jgi:L-rhamnose-H+ transport protein
MTSPQPFIGLIFHAIGGLAAASFYAPLKTIRRWPWECFYLAMGLFAWLATPWIFAFATTPDLIRVITSAPSTALGWTFLFGVLWGVGAVTYGLTMRYLGMALGMSVALGFCAVFGTLVPPIFKNELAFVVSSPGGMVVMGGVLLCVLGILISGYAGIRKESDLAGQKMDAGGAGSNSVSEFSLFKGLAVAVVTGLMSACFAFGFQSGVPIAQIAVEAGVNPLFQNNAVLCVILLGGVVTNTLWCLFLNWRNRSFPSYRSQPARVTGKILLLSALAGVIWYFQFFFYGMGMTKMGEYEFSSWTLHMSFIIIFGNLWGLFFKEWKGVSSKTLLTVWGGILVLILATVVIGWGNSLSTSLPAH